MRRDELEELHYICPIRNIPSICRTGILSHRRAEREPHESVAMVEIQERRAKIVVPGGRPLHEYVNLYVCARNPMLFKRKDRHVELCVLRVSTDVLDVPGVVVTDANASSPYVRFAGAPEGLEIVDNELTFAEYWTDQDPIRYWRRKSRKCAEVLVPDRVDLRFLTGVYVSCGEARERVSVHGTGFAPTVNPRLFFL